MHFKSNNQSNKNSNQNKANDPSLNKTNNCLIETNSSNSDNLPTAIDLGETNNQKVQNLDEIVNSSNFCLKFNSNDK